MHNSELTIEDLKNILALIEKCRVAGLFSISEFQAVVLLHAKVSAATSSAENGQEKNESNTVNKN